MTTVIYHRSDYDGIFCREIARKFLPDDTVLIGWEYNDHEPVVAPDSPLYILDLSVPGLMTHPHLIWIDHHASAIARYPATIPGYRIDGVAACRLAWQWFMHRALPDHDGLELPGKDDYVSRTVHEPFAIRLAGEYDIWDKRDERAELFQHGLRSQELKPETWSGLLAPAQFIGFESAVQKLLLAGRGVQYAKQHENASIIKSFGFTTHWEGLTFLACNHARFNSHLFDAALAPEHDALLGFNWTGKTWRVSLYHAPGHEKHDLSRIAVAHGGGGHKGACGFVTDTLPFLHTASVTT